MSLSPCGPFIEVGAFARNGRGGGVLKKQDFNLIFATFLYLANFVKALHIYKY